MSHRRVMMTHDDDDLSLTDTDDTCQQLDKVLHSHHHHYYYYYWWLGSRVVSVLDSGAVGPGFKSQSRRCRVTVLSKLLTPIVPLFTKQQNW